MDWIAGWNNRIKFSVDHNKVSNTVLDFPVMINLGTTYSGVFNELGVNAKKIAFFDANTNKQLYCEIAYWDNVNNTAQLWVKVPTISSGINTDLYMCYGSQASDNHHYVGYTGEEAGTKVWDNYFELVYHMSQDPSSTSPQILDSTSNLRNGTTQGNMTSNDLVSDSYGESIEFDGVDDYIVTPTFSANMLTSTYESFTKTVNLDTWNDFGFILSSRIANGFIIHPEDSASVKFYLYDNYSNVDSYGITTPNDIKEWHHYFISTKSGNIITGHDTDTNVNTASINLGIANGDVYIGKDDGVDRYGKIQTAEVRISSVNRDINWLYLTGYTLKDELLIKHPIETVTTGSLNYNNKIKLIILPVNDTLYNFPVLINITKQAGLNKTDLTHIFHNLESQYNRKKIAVTDESGISQCFVEIERWDHTEQSAQLWVKVPILHSTKNTTLYLYYDKNKAANILTVGDTGSYTAANVWDDNFILVHHHAYNDSIHLDSTSYKNNGYDYVYRNNRLVDSITGKALEFTSTDDVILINDDASLNITNNITVESTIFETLSNLAPRIIGRHTNSTAGTVNSQFQVGTYYDQFRWSVGTPGGNYVFDERSFKTINLNEWYCYTVTYNKIYSRALINGVPYLQTSHSDPMEPVAGHKLYIGGEYVNNTVNYNFSGIIDELRLSNIVRSDEWIKQTFKTKSDQFINYNYTPSVNWLHTVENGINSPWKNRIRLDIDNSASSSDCIDFPVLINISKNSGITNKNLEYILNDLRYNNVSDYFNGSDGETQNLTLWSDIYTETGSTVNSEINNNKLLMELTGVNSNSGDNAIIKSKYLLKYNYSVELTFSDLITNNHSGAGFTLKLTNQVDNNYIFIEAHYDSNILIRYYDGASHDTNVNRVYNYGKFKITRVVNDTSAYYIDGSGTSWNLGATTNVLGDNEVFIELSLYNYDTGDISCKVDSIIITADETHWPKNTSPNRKKIAVTTSDGETQLPVEISYWDTVTSGIQLWTKVPVLDSVLENNIYLYYDDMKSDNTSYVGDTKESPATEVWDSYEAVYHFSKDYDIPDSTSKNRDGNLVGTVNSSIYTALGLKYPLKCYNLNGTDNYIEIGLRGDDLNYPITIELVAKDTDDDYCYYLDCGVTNTYYPQYRMRSTQAEFYYNDGTSVYSNFTIGHTKDAEVYRGMSYNGEDLKAFINNQPSETTTHETPNSIPGLYRIGNSNKSEFRAVQIAELRFSSTARSNNWMNLTDISLQDNLVTYNNKEEFVNDTTEPTKYYFHGIIKENGVPLNNCTALLYHRDTHKLIDSTTSDSAGYYLLETTLTDEHFIVVLNPDGGIQYNSLLNDRLVPNGQ